jgi:hypothetical protein
MPWFKVDDQLAMHPKAARAGLAAMGLWVKAGSWSAARLTDGHVPTEVLGMLGGSRKHAQLLVDAGLWHAEPDGYRFHDWPDFQPSADDTERHREKKKRDGELAAHRRWHVRRGVTNPDCDWCLGVANV